MKKDVIYIDIEDDITSIIEKIKNSTEKIVALVPPKGNAVLQSVVNLKLLKRAAGNVSKQPVIVTNNQALTALAGGLDLYVAKNLQSKPVLASGLVAEFPEDEALEVSDDIGELAEDVPTHVSFNDDDEVELTGEELNALESENTPVAVAAKKPKEKGGKSKKVPNFDNFRKKLLVGGAIALLLVIVLLTVFGRSKANIVIRAETTPVDVALEAKFNANSATSDPNSYNLKAVAQESKKSLTQSFVASGQKDLGTKASGSMNFAIVCSAVSGNPPTIPAGTVVSANNLNFVTQAATSLTSPSFNGGCKFTGNTTVAAQNNGDQYNLSARGYSVSGFASVTGSGSQMSGGTSNIVKVISQDDVNKAKDQLSKQDTNAVKAELKKNVTADIYVLDDSFVTTFGASTSEPAVGEQANEGKFTVEATYSILGVPKQDLGLALDAFITTKMTNKDQQRVYDNGINNVKLEKISSDAKTAVYKITTLSQYGPQFDIEALKSQVTGKKFGEVRSYLQDLPGVKGVDIKLTPFWARKAPGVNRIQIKLDVDKNSGA